MCRYERLPEIEQYLDQMANYANRAFIHLCIMASADKLMFTKSMVNNNVKQKVIPKPAKTPHQTSFGSLLL